MNILVTGATGFVGGEILKKLNSENFEVYGTSQNGSSDSSQNIIKADITDSETLKNLSGNTYDAVIHSAGLAHQFGNIDKELFEKVNVVGTKNIAEFAVKAGAKQFILISSTAVYGYHKNVIDESTECRPDTDYAKSKLGAEKVCMEICEKNNIDLTIFRLAPVLGEKGIGNVPRLIGAIDKRRFIWIGDGKNKKSLIYVGDIANACLEILKAKKRATEIFNLSAPPIEMRELVKAISAALKKNVPGFSVPAFLPNLFIRANEKHFRSKFIGKYSKIFDKWLSDDIYLADKIRNEYGFEPKTSVVDAVEKQCEWYRKQRSL